VDELGPLFNHPGDFTEAIPGELALVAALIGFALGLFVLLRGNASATMLSTTLLTVPILSAALGTGVLADRSKETSFCVSCHVMQPILDSALDDQGTSLAAVHVTRGAVPRSQACYTCHAGYGMFGDVSAKLAGLRHMVVEVLETYEYPIELHGKFDVAACQSCHAESTGFRSVEAHKAEEIQQALLAGDMSCAGMCHAVAHEPEALSGEAVQ